MVFALVCARRKLAPQPLHDHTDGIEWIAHFVGYARGQRPHRGQAVASPEIGLQRHLLAQILDHQDDGLHLAAGIVHLGARQRQGPFAALSIRKTTG